MPEVLEQERGQGRVPRPGRSRDGPVCSGRNDQLREEVGLLLFMTEGNSLSREEHPGLVGYLRRWIQLFPIPGSQQVGPGSKTVRRVLAGTRRVSVSPSLTGGM